MLSDMTNTLSDSMEDTPTCTILIKHTDNLWKFPRVSMLDCWHKGCDICSISSQLIDLSVIFLWMVVWECHWLETWWVGIQPTENPTPNYPQMFALGDLAHPGKEKLLNKNWEYADWLTELRFYVSPYINAASFRDVLSAIRFTYWSRN